MGLLRYELSCRTFYMSGCKGQSKIKMNKKIIMSVGNLGYEKEEGNFLFEVTL